MRNFILVELEIVVSFPNFSLVCKAGSTFGTKACGKVIFAECVIEFCLLLLRQ